MQGGTAQHASAYGVKYQARCIAPYVTDPQRTRFLVGTQSLREENEVHVITLPDNTSDIVCEGLYTHQNEIWDLAICPFESQLISTVYASVGEYGAALWYIPDRSRGGHLNVQPLKNVASLDGHTNTIKCTLWWPSGKHNQLLSIDAENLFIWDLNTQQKLAKVQAQLSAGELHHMAGGAWDPHDVTNVATAIESSVQMWDLRSMKQSSRIEQAHAIQVRDIDFNPKNEHILSRQVKQANTWSKKVAETLSAANLSEDLWNMSESEMERTVKEAVGKTYCDKTELEAALKSSISLMRVYPEKPGFKSYLMGTPTLRTRLKFKFRAGRIPLNVKRNQMSNQPKVCNLCNDGDEGAVHYMIQCVTFTALRTMLFSDIEKLIPLELYTRFSCLESKPKAAALLSNSFLGQPDIVTSIDDEVKSWKITAGDDSKIRVWDVKMPGMPLRELPGHSHWTWRVRYNPVYEELVLSAGTDSVVNLWHVSPVSSSQASKPKSPYGSPKGPLDSLMRAYTEHEDSVYGLTWSARDPWVFASLSYDGRVMVDAVPQNIRQKFTTRGRP